MKLTSSKEDLAESKVIILYILEQIGKPTTHNDLMKIVLSITDMNYFYFQQFVLDLIAVNFIRQFHKDDLVFYELTEYGKNTLELTSNIIPGILKLKIDSNLKPYQNTIKDEISIISDFEPYRGNSFFVECQVVENHEIVFSVRILAESREQAKFICDNWKINATIMYPTLLQTLVNPPKANKNKD